jgi:flagellar basal body-associated protein FliL
MEEPSRRSPWVVGIIIGLLIVVLVNAGFIYIAMKGADQVVPSYNAEAR